MTDISKCSDVASEEETLSVHALEAHANKILSAEKSNMFIHLIGVFKELAEGENSKWESLSKKFNQEMPEISLLRHTQTKMSEALENSQSDEDEKKKLSSGKGDVNTKLLEKYAKFVKDNNDLLRMIDEKLELCTKDRMELSGIITAWIMAISHESKNSTPTEYSDQLNHYLSSCKELSEELERIKKKLEDINLELEKSPIYAYYRGNNEPQGEKHMPDAVPIPLCPKCGFPLSYQSLGTFSGDYKTAVVCYHCDYANNLNR